MSRAVVVAFGLVTACTFEHGAATFDAVATGSGDSALDTPPGLCSAHDFDGDGLGDECDLCPHIPSANVDKDNDGVGDECDPRPLSPGEHRAIWLAFYDATDITGWVNTGGGGAWAISNNLLHETNTAFALLDSPMSYTSDMYFATSLVITQPSTPEVGFCTSDIQPGMQYYCCGAYNSAGPNVRAVVAYSTSGGQVPASTPFAGNLGVGGIVDMTGTLIGAQFKCRFTQGPFVSNTMTSAGSRTGPVVFYTTAPVDYRYVFVVTIGA